MRRIFQAAILVVVLSAWPLWLAYQEEARRRGGAELRAAKAERELEEERRHRAEAERRVPYETAVSWFGPYGKRLVAAWEVLNDEQETQMVAFAEALAAGEPWPPCAVPDQPTTRREGSSPPVSTEVNGEPGISVSGRPDGHTLRLGNWPPSHVAYSVPPLRQAALEKLVEACRAWRRADKEGTISTTSFALDVMDAALRDLDDLHITGPDNPKPLAADHARAERIRELILKAAQREDFDGRGLYHAAPAQAATATRPTGDEAPRPIAHHAATLTAQERLLVELFGRLDAVDRDRLVLLAGMLSRGAQWPHEDEAVDHYREGLYKILSGEADPVSTAALYLGEEVPGPVVSPEQRAKPFAEQPAPRIASREARYEAVMKYSDRIADTGSAERDQPTTACEPQRLGDSEEEERAADAWVRARFAPPAESAAVLARAAEGLPARRRAQIRMLRATASELAASTDGDWERGVVAFLAWAFENARASPSLPSAPTNCPQHGPAIEPGGFTSHCSRLPSCPGGAS